MITSIQSLQSIVVGIDFKTPCASAVRTAIRLASWNGSSLRAVHVIDSLVAREIEDALSAFQSGIREGLIEDARRAWATFAGGIPGAQIVPLDVRIDGRVHGLIAGAEEAKADLLVLGAHRGKRTEGVGTMARSCVRHAGCDVLLVRESAGWSGPDGPFRCVVACVDFSATSLRALAQAARVAAQDRAALHVLHVFTPPWQQLHYRAPTPEADATFIGQYRASLRGRLEAFGAEVMPEALKPTFEIYEYEGHRSGIVEYASNVGADLIVLGTRGRTTFRDLTLGSTAEKALSETRCSVLAVKPEAHEASIEEPHAQIRAQM